MSGKNPEQYDPATKYSMILLSGGHGHRMKNSIPKQYMLLAGKPVIMHILEKVDLISEITEIIIVCADEYRTKIQDMIMQYGIHKRIKFAGAGASRQASVKSGLDTAAEENIIIHEAARPFIKVDDIKKLIDIKSVNAMLGLEIPFTVIRGHEFVEAPLNRTELVNVQLPQKFSKTLLLKAHNKAIQENTVFTEDASMVNTYFPEEKIEISRGMEYNIKLTTPLDMLLGELIYEENFRRRK